MSLEIVEANALDSTRIKKPARDIILYVETMLYEPNTKFKIYLQQEPEAIMPLTSKVIENHRRWDVILTYSDEILTKCPNARFFHFYTPTWIDETTYMNIDTSVKEFKISSCVGFKQITIGHHFRLQLYFSQEKFRGNRFVFFRSGQGPLLPSIHGQTPILNADTKGKFALFERFQFSLVIENSRQRYYFTEKLMDCLITKTIPIYYGCTNIEDYFDTRGWILLTSESVEELVEKSKVLNETYYAQHKDVIEENYRRCFQYKDIYGKLNKVLESIPEYNTPLA